MRADTQERWVVFAALAAGASAASLFLQLPAFKAVLLGVLGLLVVLFTNPYQRWRHRHIPGPPYRPLVGNLPDIMAVGSHAFFDECRQRYGRVFVVWFGARPWVVVADADVGRRANYRLLNRPGIMISPLARGEAAKTAAEGLFVARDGAWSMLRKVWQPAFHSESLAGYAPVMAAEVRRLVGKLEGAAASGEVINVWRDVGELTMGVVGTTAFGVDFGLLRHGEEAPRSSSSGGGGGGGERCSSDSGSSDSCSPRGSGAASRGPCGSPRAAGGGAGCVAGASLVSAAAELFASTELRTATRYVAAAHIMPLILPAISLLAALLPDERYRRMVGARNTLRACSQSLIDATRAAARRARGPGAPDAAPSPSGGGKRPQGVAPGSFLGLLLAAKDSAGHGLSDTQMAAQANVFTLAGYETTANTLSYAIYCLAAHPEAQAKLLAELDALGGGPERDVTLSDLPQLPFTAAVVDEALRLYPPAASTMREARGGIELGGYRVPNGTTVIVATYSLQRDPAYWPKAADFLPERWTKGHEDLAATNPNAYLPFGAGARACVGYRFALQEVRLTLAQLYRRFTFELVPGQVPLRVRTGLTMSPQDGVFVRAMPRVY